MTLNDKLATIQTKFKSKKSRFNSFGKYYFRSAEDILEATKPFLLVLGVTITLNENLIKSKPIPIIESVATISDGKNSIKATALVGVVLLQKGMQTPQQFGSASSYRKKYALGNLFLIDDTQDSDAVNDHNKSMTPDQIAQAKKFLKSGGKLAAIKAKYHINSKLEQELTTL